jgi:hypothetical protein
MIFAKKNEPRLQKKIKSGKWLQERRPHAAPCPDISSLRAQPDFHPLMAWRFCACPAENPRQAFLQVELKSIKISQEHL